MDGKYIARPLAKTIRSAKSKVIILEGARAVGKTMMMRREFTSLGYQYFTLADGNTFRLASKDLESWISDLPIPAIVDEAQRIPGLPLAVKERVDGIASDSPLFILTGSASINKYGLDGQNPLTAIQATHFAPLHPKRACRHQPKHRRRSLEGQAERTVSRSHLQR